MKNSHQVARWIVMVLIAIMLFRITSYFTLMPSSVGLTRVLKIGLRFLMTGISGYMLLATVASQKKRIFQYQFGGPFLFYSLYLLLGIVSIIWTTDLPYTVLQLAMVLESFVFVWLFIRLLLALQPIHYDARLSLAFLMNRAIFIIGIAFLVGLIVAPDTFYRDTHGGEVSRLGGFIINPNELGMLAVLGALMAFVEIKKEKALFFNLLSLIVAVAILLLTQSRSSLGAFALVSAYFVLTSRYKLLKVAAVTGAVLVLPVILNTIIFKQGDVEEVMSMTGRLPFWNDLIHYGFPQRPLHGFGFMSISPSPFTNKFDSIHSYAASMTHNTFVQVLLNLGLIGAFICLFQMLTTFFALAKSSLNPNRIVFALMLVPLLINSMTEFGIFGESNYGILFYQFIIVGLFVTRRD